MKKAINDTVTVDTIQYGHIFLSLYNITTVHIQNCTCSQIMTVTVLYTTMLRLKLCTQCFNIEINTQQAGPPQAMILHVSFWWRVKCALLGLPWTILRCMRTMVRVWTQSSTVQQLSVCYADVPTVGVPPWRKWARDIAWEVKELKVLLHNIVHLERTVTSHWQIKTELLKGNLQKDFSFLQEHFLMLNDTEHWWTLDIRRWHNFFSWMIERSIHLFIVANSAGSDIMKYILYILFE